MPRFNFALAQKRLTTPIHVAGLVGLAGLVVFMLATAWSQEDVGSDEAVIPLYHAAAIEVAPQVERVLLEVEPDAQIRIDRQKNALIVRASEVGKQRAAELAEIFDRPRNAQEGGEARDESNLVKAYAVPPDQLRDRLLQMRQRYANQRDVKIGSDERFSRLIVIAPPEIQQQIARELEVDGQPTPGVNDENAQAAVAAPSVLRVQLQNISWQDFENYLRDVWGEQLRIDVDQSGRVATIPVPTMQGEPTILQIDRPLNTVHVIAPMSAQNAWRQLIAAVDVAPQEVEATRLVSTQSTDPRRIENAVRLLQDAARGAAEGLFTAAVRWSEQGAGERVFLVKAQEEGGAAAAQPQQPQAQPGAQPPEGAQPEGVVPIDDEDAGLLGNVQIEFIPEYGVLIVKGKRRDVERVLRIIERIQEVARVAEPDIVILPLQHVYSGAMADLIVDLYTEIFEPRQGPLSITPLEKPNALLLIGREESMAVVRQLIDRLDQPEIPSTRLKVFRLQHVSAVDAETLVNNFFNQAAAAAGQPGAVPPAAAPGQAAPGQQTTQQTELGTRARVVAEYRTNSLIVQASPRDLQEVAFFIQSIDVDETGAEHEVRIIRLRHTLAQELAPVLQAAISGAQLQTTGGGQGQVPGAFQQQGQPQQLQGGQNVQTTRPSARISIQGIDAEQNEIFTSGVLTDVTVSADPNVNALVVIGPPRSMNLIEELIRQLDQPPEAEAQIKVFQVENGDATNLTAMLQELFGLQVTAGQGTLGQTLNQAFGLGQVTTAGGETSLVPLRFAVDIRTNSIIASGSASDLAVVEVLLLRLDEGDIEARKIFVYRLKNTYSVEIADAITAFLTSQRQLIQQQLLFNQAVSPFEQIEREIIVVAEPISNSLIVSVTPRYYEEVIQIIQDLDFRPPMVMVQVMICEVALTDNFEFGVEFGLQDSLLFDRSVVAGNTIIPGFNFNNQPLGNSSQPQSLATRETLGGQSLSTFGLGRTSANLGYGGLVLSASNESVSILVRALQDAGRLQILSRPQIMTLDNQEAFVQVGARVSRITGSTITANGGVQNQAVDVDIGLLLNIRPRINEDGLIVMIIDTEKSELGDAASGTPVAIDNNGQVINSPPINTTTAQTTVSAKSGQTVVLGGLITKNRSIQSRRIPYLSDLPVVGRLFRFDQEADTRTELLIFMTPYIIQDDQDYEWIKYVESERMSWCLSDLIEMHGDVGLSGGHGLWGPPIAPTIYPDMDPTGGEIVPAPAPGMGPAPMMKPTPADNPFPPYGNPDAPPVDDGSSRRGTIIRDVQTNVELGPTPVPVRRAPRWPTNDPVLLTPDNAGVEPAGYQDYGYSAFPPP